MSEQPNPHALFPVRTWLRQLFLLTACLSADFSTTGHAQAFDGQVTHSFSFEWDGTSFQVIGFPGQPFPSLNLY